MSKKYKPIPLAREVIPAERLEEACCFCRERTTYWTDVLQRTEEQQVPCCIECSETFRQKDVPSKQYWLRVVSLVLHESGRAFRAGRQSMLAGEGEPEPESEAKPEPAKGGNSVAAQ